MLALPCDRMDTLSDICHTTTQVHQHSIREPAGLHAYLLACIAHKSGQVKLLAVKWQNKVGVDLSLSHTCTRIAGSNDERILQASDLRAVDDVIDVVGLGKLATR